MDVLREDPVELLLGTASAHLFHLSQGGTAKSIDTFGSLACRSDWYTPWGGPPAVRSIALGVAGPDIFGQTEAEACGIEATAAWLAKNGGGREK